MKRALAYGWMVVVLGSAALAGGLVHAASEPGPEIIRQALDARLYERVPIDEDFDGLRAQMSQAATQGGLKLQKFVRVKKKRGRKPLPPSQTLDEDLFSIVVAGQGVDNARLTRWVASWKNPESPLRRHVVPVALGTAPGGGWRLIVRAYHWQESSTPASAEQELVRTRERLDVLRSIASAR